MTTKISNITNLDNVLSTKNFIDSNKEVDLSNQLSFDVIESNMKDFLSKKHLSNLYEKSNVTSNDKLGVRLMELILFSSVYSLAILIGFSSGFFSNFCLESFFNLKFLPIILIILLFLFSIRGIFITKKINYQINIII